MHYSNLQYMVIPRETTYQCMDFHCTSSPFGWSIHEKLKNVAISWIIMARAARHTGLHYSMAVITVRQFTPLNHIRFYFMYQL